MKFDPWTFVFQIVNFCVLLIVLKRILYKPVREIMEQRRAIAVKKLADAEKVHQQAEDLKMKLESDQKKFAAQRNDLLDTMKSEVARQRQTMLKEAEQEVQRLLEKGRALYEVEKKKQVAENKEQAVAAVELFAARILESLADEQLQQALFRKLMEDLEQIGAILCKAADSSQSLDIEVASAFPLSEEQERILKKEFDKQTGCETALKTLTQCELIAGFRIMAGDQVYDASFNGQLAAFANQLKESP